MPVLKTLVDPEAKVQFQQLARSQGMSESECLRAVVLEKIGDAQNDDTDNAGLKPDALNTEADQITVRMPRFLMEAVKERAKAKGMASKSVDCLLGAIQPDN